jgi:uncharacterized cupredoxin-like copper-binding protein
MKMRFLALGALILSSVLVLAGCGSTTAASNTGVQNVTITTTEFKIESSLTTFTVGTKYHFVVTNKGQVQHEVMAGPIAKAKASEEERDAASLFEIADIDAGETKTADYTFTTVAPPGTLEFSCHEPGHYESGMRLDITVK